MDRKAGAQQQVTSAKSACLCSAGQPSEERFLQPANGACFDSKSGHFFLGDHLCLSRSDVCVCAFRPVLSRGLHSDGRFRGPDPLRGGYRSEQTQAMCVCVCVCV